ncbi:hypothetical protein M405DRAFT_863127 [Rhizopogon salebrosus TDB-379]|nr:hypothetical protein M405DRAFT_863127 [Rhizopogon salebrosus TDB-379]
MRDISDEDLHTRVVKKYQDLQKNMRKAGKLSATLTATTTAADSVENAPSSAAVITTTSRSKLQSRARGKLEVRVRKFENLLEASDFADQKYRAAFTESLMSERERLIKLAVSPPVSRQPVVPTDDDLDELVVLGFVLVLVLVWMDDGYKRGNFSYVS